MVLREPLAQSSDPLDHLQPLLEGARTNRAGTPFEVDRSCTSAGQKPPGGRCVEKATRADRATVLKRHDGVSRSRVDSSPSVAPRKHERSTLRSKPGACLGPRFLATLTLCKRELAAAERMRLALELAELGEAMFRQRLRRDQPQLTQDEIDALVDAWRPRRPGAEHGDAQGRPVAWPRRP